MDTTRRNALLSALAFAATPVDRLVAQGKQVSDLEKILSLPEFETLAHDRISNGAWARIQGGAADEITLRWNLEAYQHIRLRPRVLVDVSKLDTRVSLFGQELPFPIFLAPTGAQR